MKTIIVAVEHFAEGGFMNIAILIYDGLLRSMQLVLMILSCLPGAKGTVSTEIGPAWHTFFLL
jgi:hypothetical protein